jgi:hypothetical protein
MAIADELPRLFQQQVVVCHIQSQRQQVGDLRFDRLIDIAEWNIGLHLVKCLAQTQGNKVRVNAVLPGLLLTDWVCIPVLGVRRRGSALRQA